MEALKEVFNEISDYLEHLPVLEVLAVPHGVEFFELVDLALREELEVGEG